MIIINNLQKLAIGTTSTLLLLTQVVGTAFAKPPGAQVFDVYDNTNDGLQVGTDPTIGQVEFNANPGGKARIIVEVHALKTAPNCTYTAQLVRDSAASNGGLNTLGHSGSIQALGTLTTNGVGNGNAHFDLDPSGDGVADTVVYGHIDLEDLTGTCTEADGTGVVNNEYGAAPDQSLSTPLTWMD